VALLLIPLAGLAARRRWSAYVVGGSLAVFAVMLVPLLFTTLADFVSISQARRAAGFLPFAFAFAGGLGVLSALLGRVLLPFALLAGIALQVFYPGDFEYMLDDTAPAWIVWFAVAGGLVALVLGLIRRRPPLEAPAALAAALFLIPVVIAGLWNWDRAPASPNAALSPGLVSAVRENVSTGSIVYSDQETSYRLAASRRCSCVAPRARRGHGRSAVRACSGARRFLRTGDLSIPELRRPVRGRRSIVHRVEPPVVYRWRYPIDSRRLLTRRSPATAARRLDTDRRLEIVVANAGTSGRSGCCDREAVAASAAPRLSAAG
jgi:hypothetical protein